MKVEAALGDRVTVDWSAREVRIEPAAARG
jgi:hypothetical protein